MDNLRNQKFTEKMQRKLAVSFMVVLLAFMGLSTRLYAISRDNGDQYKKQVLSQQSYDSVVLPAKRGEIVDCNGTKIAVSQKVYNVVVDAKTLNQKDGQFLEPTLTVLYEQPDISYNYTRSELRDYIVQNPGSQYRIIAKKQTYEAVSGLMTILNDSAKFPNIKGVWLEEAYQRNYPYDSLACDVIGFVQGDNEGSYGLEEYYNDILTGINGREYGYLNDDSNLERTIKPAENGKTLVTSLDVNIQSIIEKHILAFNKEHENEAREGNGSKNTGVIVMNPNTGEILAMASYPVYNLNDPRNTDGLTIEVSEDYGMNGIVISENGEEEGSTEAAEGTAETAETAENTADTLPDAEETAGEPVLSANVTSVTAPAGTELPETGEEAEAPAKQKTYEEAYEDAKMEALNALWKNFCINSTYEPGSTMKPFTMATGLESGELTGEENFVCNGVKEVGGHKIHCNNRLGHGKLTFSGALEQSCNVAFMNMGAMIGKDVFLKYNREFNFGLKTNIDLTGEALTNSLVFDLDTMTPTDLAISSFGQGFNVTMIQMITGFCSLINGGYYYQPHVVTKVLNDDGVVVNTFEPRVLKQTISKETSDKIVELCDNVVSQGTGKSARPAGYRIGGKTGTAEKYPRKRGNYLVSFMGFAPAENPQVVIYTVIDEPNVPSQASARYATVLTRDILTELLPYMHIFMTEELTEDEKAELMEKQIAFAVSASTEEEETGEVQLDEEGNPIAPADDSPQNTVGTGDEETITIIGGEEPETYEKKELSIDRETGYAIDPETGILLDPTTYAPVDPYASDLE
ncbi:MAG: cell division protein FtsI [Lachnospiraceae bacterium]|nr:cell division protein FtsI [Lachnospiraceae bacterium]